MFIIVLEHRGVATPQSHHQFEGNIASMWGVVWDLQSAAAKNRACQASRGGGKPRYMDKP
jgi:hypothetical protein